MNNKVYAADLAKLLLLSRDRTMIIIGSKQSVAKDLLQDIREDLLSSPKSDFLGIKLTVDNKTKLALNNGCLIYADGPDGMCMKGRAFRYLVYADKLSDKQEADLMRSFVPLFSACNTMIISRH